jgi:hypothetical protein
MTSTRETINLTQEQLEETRKKFTADYKPAQNMVQIDISIPWESSLLLPYSDAMKFMAALESAELISNRSYGNDTVKTYPMNKGVITLGLMDKQSYTNIKVAELLGLTNDQLAKLNKGEELDNDN